MMRSVRLTYEGVPAEYFSVLNGLPIPEGLSGNVRYHPAFG